MEHLIRFSFASAWLAGALFLSMAVCAQQKAQPVSPGHPAYDLARETVLEGTVIKYIEASTVPPLGAHVTVQTASGPVDVHIGNARFLQVNHFALHAGDQVRIVGESLAYGEGTQFVARVIQNGQQTLVVRSIRGFPLYLGGARASGAKNANPPGGVL